MYDLCGSQWCVTINPWINSVTGKFLVDWGIEIATGEAAMSMSMELVATKCERVSRTSIQNPCCIIIAT